MPSSTIRRPRKAGESQERAIYSSVEELARELGLSRQTVYTGLRNNSIPHIRLGKRYILPKAAIAEWLRKASSLEGDFAAVLRTKIALESLARQ